MLIILLCQYILNNYILDCKEISVIEPYLNTMQMKRFDKIIHIVILNAFLGIGLPSVFSEQLYVYYPSLSRPHVIQKELTNEIPGVQVTVFGLRDDFDALVKSAPPDAILAKGPLAGMYSDYTMVLSGVINGKTDGTSSSSLYKSSVDTGQSVSKDNWCCGYSAKEGTGDICGNSSFNKSKTQKGEENRRPATTTYFRHGRCSPCSRVPGSLFQKRFQS